MQAVFFVTKQKGKLQFEEKSKEKYTADIPSG